MFDWSNSFADTLYNWIHANRGSSTKQHGETQPRSQAPSPLHPLVVGINTLVAAAHVTTQNLGGKEICWAGGVAECFDCCCDKL